MVEAKCECVEEKGIPEGWLCGKPECPRTVEANRQLEKLARILFGDPPSQTK